MESGVEILCEKIDSSISNYTSGVLRDFIRVWDSRFKKIGVFLNTSLNLSGELTSSYISKINDVIYGSENDLYVDLLCDFDYLGDVIDGLTDDSNFDDINNCLKKIGEVFSCCAAEINNLSRIIDKLIEIIPIADKHDFLRIKLDIRRIKHDIISWLRDIGGELFSLGDSKKNTSISDLEIFIDDQGELFNLLLEMPTEGFEDQEIYDGDNYMVYVRNDTLAVEIIVEKPLHD